MGLVFGSKIVEIEQVDGKISELEQEKRALRKQLSKARAERAGISLVDRKNSGARVLAENTVLLALRQAEKPLHSHELLQRARRTNFDLKETTFRSYLHRLKVRGLITGGGRRGYWKLSPDKSKP